MGGGRLQGPRAADPGTSVRRAISQPGTPIPAPVRERMEAQFGASFNDVRVHTGPDAADAAASVDAVAFTSGTNLVFSPRTYDPSSRGGQQLLAHELAHVIQQRRGPVDGTPMEGGLKVSDPGDRFERAADQLSTQAAAGPAQSGGELTPDDR